MREKRVRWFPLTLFGLLLLGACAVLVAPPGPDATRDRGRQLYNAGTAF